MIARVSARLPKAFDVTARAVRATLDSPALWITVFAVLGLVLTVGTIHVVTGACHKAIQSAHGTGAMLWRTIRVTREQCLDAQKNPPWLVLPGLVAAPAVLLTWYWREKKRRSDESAADNAHSLSTQVAFSERYAKAAELLASSEVMTRIYGLESLWDIALQSAAHREAINRTLAAFVRTRSLDATRAASTTDLPDLQIAATLLGRREWDMWPREPVDLQAAFLVHMRLCRASLQHAILEGANLTGAILPDATLTGANLARGIFTGANFARANLAGADLTDANLERASFVGANLAHAQLIGANLKEANLEGANLDGAHLKNAHLEQAVLIGAILTDAHLEYAILTGAILHEANLARAKLRLANLEDASPAGANLEGADLIAAKLKRADLGFANLAGACLGEADLTEASLAHANLDGVNLTGANLADSSLEFANLADTTNLKSANLTGAHYNDDTRLPDDFPAQEYGMTKDEQEDMVPAGS